MNRLDFPNRVTIELTNRCNVSCTFCHRQVVQMELGDMSYELYNKIIDVPLLYDNSEDFFYEVEINKILNEKSLKEIYELLKK